MRQTLIAELKWYIGELTEWVDGKAIEPTTADEVVDLLDFYFRFDADSDGDTELALPERRFPSCEAVFERGAGTFEHQGSRGRVTASSDGEVVLRFHPKR